MNVQIEHFQNMKRWHERKDKSNEQTKHIKSNERELTWNSFSLFFYGRKKISSALFVIDEIILFFFHVRFEQTKNVEPQNEKEQQKVMKTNMNRFDSYDFDCMRSSAPFLLFYFVG